MAATMVTLTLSHDQALILFEWLSREDGKNTIPTTHESELKVLWGIEAQLEKVLVEPLQANYAAVISAARERVASADSSALASE